MLVPLKFLHRLFRSSCVRERSGMFGHLLWSLQTNVWIGRHHLW